MKQAKLTLAIGLLVILFSYNQPKPDNNSDAKFFEGRWTYRSLHNFPIDTSFCNLEFATAVMIFEKTKGDSIVGILDMGDFGKLNLHGKTINDNHSITFNFQGDGIPNTNTNGWQYNYHGYVVPKWINGIKQVEACVGSVIRSKDHGNSKAGKTASFYMNRQ
jgi:hypothetical protein